MFVVTLLDTVPAQAIAARTIRLTATVRLDGRDHRHTHANILCCNVLEHLL